MTGYWDQLAGLAEKWLPALLQMELQLTVVILLALLTDRCGSGLPFDNAYRAQPLAAPQENDERLPFTNELDLRVAKRLTYGPGYISV